MACVLGMTWRRFMLSPELLLAARHCMSKLIRSLVSAVLVVTDKSLWGSVFLWYVCMCYHWVQYGKSKPTALKAHKPRVFSTQMRKLKTLTSYRTNLQKSSGMAL